MKLVRDDVRLYLITGTVDMRMGIDGYIAVVQNRLHMNVFDNFIFLFCNKDHSKLKMLYWDSTGFWLFYKRLEKGKLGSGYSTNGLKKETISNGFVMKKIIQPQSPRSSTDG